MLKSPWACREKALAQTNAVNNNWNLFFIVVVCFIYIWLDSFLFNTRWMLLISTHSSEVSGLCVEEIYSMQKRYLETNQ